MAIPNTPSILEINDLRLARSADSLESALAQFSKLTTSFEHNTVTSILSGEGKGFDEWLASDLLYGALLNGDETSVNTSSYSVQEQSPVLEYEILCGTAAPSLFGCLNSSLTTHSYNSQDLLDSVTINEITSLGLTTSKLQQAAAALNIPWSPELEKVVLAQTKKLPALSTAHHDESEPSSPSSVSVVNKTKSPSKRVHAAEGDESEELLAKRAKNTDAARRSRLKKLVKLEGLEVKVAELEATNHRLSTRVAVLETEKNGFLIKEAEQNARIAQLEAKVMEARLTLNTRGS
ncbi:hypothetical protein BGZ65_001821 [Modicella reniformis]|uniref:BZIP domain-containing protein n=1 Tax=Modicella reniformis TaxID=1440133 RepID=A0A9P6J6C7_9FUNG|nr:hypothetical protein BGZ65_001821 [Modicella reniformis]